VEGTITKCSTSHRADNMCRENGHTTYTLIANDGHMYTARADTVLFKLGVDKSKARKKTINNN